MTEAGLLSVRLKLAWRTEESELSQGERHMKAAGFCSADREDPASSGGTTRSSAARR